MNKPTTQASAARHFKNVAAIYTHRVVTTTGRRMAGGGLACSLAAAQAMQDAHAAMGRQTAIVSRTGQ